MITLHFVENDGTTHDVFARTGGSLMEVAVRNGMPGILAECGGSCACATCHVVIPDDWRERVGPANGMEEQLLELVDEQPGSRLSCQVKLRQELDGLVIRLPDS